MLETLGKLWQIYRPFRRPLLVFLGFVVFQQMLGLIPGYLIGQALNLGINNRPIEEPMKLLAVAATVSVFYGVIFMMVKERYEVKYFDRDIRAFTNNLTWQKVLRFSIGQHVSRSNGVRRTVIAKGEHALTTFGYALLYNVLPALLSLILIVAAMTWMNWRVGMILLVGAVLFIATMIWINLSMRDVLKQFEIAENRNSKMQGDFLYNAPFVIANAQEARVARECAEDLEQVHDIAMKMWYGYTRMSACRNLAVHLTRFAILFAGIYLAYQGTFAMGSLLVFWQWSSSALARAETLGDSQRQLMKVYSSVRQFLDLLEVETDVPLPENPVRLEHLQGRIEFRNVSFMYKPRTEENDEEEETAPASMPDAQSVLALRNVSFTIEPGEKVAIVGSSGAGKSSIVQILQRAHDPFAGAVLIDGHDLRTLDLSKYRQKLGVVDQQVPLVAQSLGYNITFGLNGRAKDVSDAELDRVARIACLDGFVKELERGYDTPVGERGLKLSGGEQQRAGIARAVIKDPRILIFDEATSSLDAENEAMIHKAIEEVAKGRTTILIAHRLSTVRDADKIIVLDKGRIIGQGTHDVLMTTCAKYENLVKRQLAM